MSQIGMPKTECCLENLRDISPYTEIEIHTIKLTEENIPELLGNADIICEAFDKADQKAMLVNTVLETFPDKYMLSGTGMAGFGSANTIQSRKVFGKFYLCGDEKSDVNDGIGLVASRVMVCAAHEAHMVLRILSGELDV
jgi:sulfur carrier protein ThiS adenylyltransferase